MFVLLKVIITLQRIGRPILPELKFLFIELNLKYLFMSVTRMAKVQYSFALNHYLKTTFDAPILNGKVPVVKDIILQRNPVLI